MNVIKKDNSDLTEYLKVLKALKQYPTMEEYRYQYAMLRTNGDSADEADMFYSDNKELRRLDKKRRSMRGTFIMELNPEEKSKKSAESIQRYVLAQSFLAGKNDQELFSMMIEKRMEDLSEYQRAIERNLNQLLEVKSDLESAEKNERRHNLSI